MGDQEGASFASDISSIFVAVNVLSARRSFFQTSFKERISFMGRLCHMHEINNSRISCFLFDIIKRIWIIWEWNPVQGLLWQYFFFILLSLTGDLYVTIQAPSFHVMSNPPTNLGLSLAMPGFLSDPGVPGVRSMGPVLWNWLTESKTFVQTKLMWLWLMKIQTQY